LKVECWARRREAAPRDLHGRAGRSACL